MINALSDSLACTGNGYGSLGRVGQHLGSDLNRSSRDLSDLLDLGATFANERSALRGRYYESKSYRWPGHLAATRVVALPVMKLRAPLLELLADQGERLEDGIGRTGHGHYALRARAIGDVDLGTRLQSYNVGLCYYCT